MPFSEKSRAILEAISKGHTYEQILVQELAWTYHDIFSAAAEALGVAPDAPHPPTPGKAYRVDEIRTEHPQAYAKWDDQQDGQLRQLFHAGKSVSEIAEAMQRQSGGIKSRLVKLNLVESSDAAQ